MVNIFELANYSMLFSIVLQRINEKLLVNYFFICLILLIIKRWLLANLSPFLWSKLDLRLLLIKLLVRFTVHSLRLSWISKRILLKLMMFLTMKITSRNRLILCRVWLILLIVNYFLGNKAILNNLRDIFSFAELHNILLLLVHKLLLLIDRKMIDIVI